MPSRRDTAHPSGAATVKPVGSWYQCHPAGRAVAPDGVGLAGTGDGLSVADGDGTGVRAAWVGGVPVDTAVVGDAPEVPVWPGRRSRPTATAASTSATSTPRAATGRRRSPPTAPPGAGAGSSSVPPGPGAGG